MNFAWVFLVNSLTPILFTSSVSGVDLIKKSIEDGHTIGLVSTSQGSYSINSTLDEYKEDASDFPFSWVPPTLDDIDFVQFDFRIPYSITSLTVILNPFGGTYAHQNTAFYSALSKDGINWQLNTDPAYIFNEANVGFSEKIISIGGTKARYVRFYSLGRANDTTEWSFKVEGDETSDYVQFSTSDYTMPCHGYQARIDYSVVAAKAHDNCLNATVEVLVNNKEDREFMEANIHSMYQETIIMPKFHKCVFSLVIEAFQSTQNASYQLKVELPDMNDGDETELFISEALEFAVTDDGFPNNELMYIVTEGGNYFVSTAPYVFNSPNSFIGNMDTIRQACIEYRDNADVLDISLFDHFQAGGTNNFIQTLMHLSTNTSFAKETVNSTFLMFKDAEFKQCVKMNDQFGIDIFDCDPTQHKVDYIFCLHTEGEISNISVKSESCEVVGFDRGCVNLNLQVSAVLMGARLSRNLTCTARDFANLEIESERKMLTVWSKEYKTLQVQMCFSNNRLISKVSCFANRKLVTTAENPLIEVAEFVLPTELGDDHKVKIHLQNLDTPRGGTPDSRNVLYLESYFYGKEYEIVMDTSGYPIEEFEGAFEKKFDTETSVESSKDGLETNRTFECFDDGKIVIHAVGTRTFRDLQPEHSGRYKFYIDSLSSDFTSSQSVELVHPFKIECDSSCGSSTVIGRPFEIKCSVDHHFLTKADKYDKAGEAPLQIKVAKTGTTDGYDMNPCEYNIPVNRTLTSDDFDTINLKFQEEKRKLDINFKIKSFQTWHVGTYYISVKENDDQNCYYAPNKTPCGTRMNYTVPDDCPEVSTDSADHLIFEAVPQNDVGSASADVEGLCSRNPRAMYFADPTEEEQDRFYYKICDFDKEKKIPPEQVCGADGGEVVDMARDYVTNVLLTAFEDDSDDFTYDNEPSVNLLEAWEVLACNFKFQNEDEDTMEDYEMKYFTFIGESVSMMKFKDKDKKFEYTSDMTGKTGLMCRYRRGYSWDIYAPRSNCRYEKLDINQGLEQEVKMKTHGNLKVSFLCEAIPPDSFPNVTFNQIEGEEGLLVYKLKYPDELDVEKIRCIQLQNETIFGSKDPPKFEWKEIEFSSTPMRLNVRGYVEDYGLWCSETNSSLVQPCYNKTIKLTACAEGNPLESCTWRRHNTDEEHKLVSGSDGISWNMVPDEREQCNNTRKCSTLTFESFQEDQQGFYYFECKSGTENVKKMPEPLRKTSKTVKIFSQQSSPRGTRQISFFIDCQKKTMRGFLQLYGPKVSADVKCKHSTNGAWENYRVNFEEPGPGAWDITFELERATRESVCEFTAANRYKPDNPIKFETSLKKLFIVESVAMRRDHHNEKRFCCSICAFEVTKIEDMPIECFLGEPDNRGREISLSDEVQADDFVFSAFSTTRCVTLNTAVIATFYCSCKVGERSGALTVRGSGAVEIMTAPPVTQPKFMTFKLPDLTTTPSKKPEQTTPAPSTTQPHTEVYVNQNDHNIQLAAEEVDRLIARPEVVYTELHKGGLQIVKNIRKNPPKEVVENVMDFLDKIPKIKKITTNETEVTPEKQDDLAAKLVPMCVDAVETIALESTEFATDEKQAMPGLDKLKKALLHVGHFFRANKTMKYQTKHTHVRVDKLPENLDDIPIHGIELVETDYGGVTRGALQGVNITRAALMQAQPGSVVVSFIVDQDVAQARQKLQHKETSSSEGNFAETQIYIRRAGDLVDVSSQDPEGSPVNLELEYHLNLHQVFESKAKKNVYESETELTCAYFNEESQAYDTKGLRLIYRDDSRGSCASQHTTAFSILAQMTSSKTDESEERDYHSMAWIGFIPASLLTAGCFIFLLYIHEALEQDQEEQNVRRLLTLLAFQTFLCAYLAGANRTDQTEACAASQIALHSSMMSVLGCLLNEIIYLLKEVTPSMWKKQYFPLIYLLNTVFLPIGLGLAGFILSIPDDHTHYSCFFPYDTLCAYFLIYSPMVLILLIGGVVLHRVIYNNAYKLSRQMEEYDIPDDLEFTIRTTVRILFPFPPLFVLYVYIMNQENALLHVLMGLLGFFQAILLMVILVTSPVENHVAWLEMKTPQFNPKKKINKKAKFKQQMTQSRYNVSEDGRISKSPMPGNPQQPRAGGGKPRRGLLAEEELEFSDSERSTLSALSNEIPDSGSSRATSARSGRSN